MRRFQANLTFSGALERLSDTALDIYQGDFLPLEEELYFNPIRERLRSRFGRSLERMAQMLVAAGEHEKAALLYDRAAEAEIPVQKRPVSPPVPRHSYHRLTILYNLGPSYRKCYPFRP
jgi:hypothetical protein